MHWKFILKNFEIFKTKKTQHTITKHVEQNIFINSWDIFKRGVQFCLQSNHNQLSDAAKVPF